VVPYEVRPAPNGRWTVVNDRDEVVFTGRWEQCEDWLDLHENVRPGAQHNRSGGRLARMLRRLLGWGAECIGWLGRHRSIAI
jgi:hypothetical protein